MIELSRSLYLMNHEEEKSLARRTRWARSSGIPPTMFVDVTPLKEDGLVLHSGCCHASRSPGTQGLR